MRFKFFKTLWTGFFSILVIIALGVFFIEKGWLGYLPDLEELQNPINRYASQVLTADGKLMGTWSRNENRVFVAYDSVSPYVFQALVATEDARFFEHSGIDVKAVGRAIIKRGILGRKNAGGGSTISQQLAKQLYSETAHNIIQRALQKPIEWVIAVELERFYTKEEIMSLYLNYFDFLHNAVGINTAANVYFSKHPKELTINDAALLIGMCKNPAYYNPVRNPERCIGRRNVVLQQMVKEGYLSKEDYQKLSKEDLNLRFHQVDHKEGQATYLREYLRRIMMADKPNKANYAEWQMPQYYADSYAWDNDPLYGWCKKNKKRDGSNYDLYVDGLRIYTTIDSRMQEFAEQSVYQHVVHDLQTEFNKQRYTSSTFPYSSNLTNTQVQQILNRSKRQSDRYYTMKSLGASNEEIDRAFNTKTKMRIFTYHGEVDTLMTPMDSIRYYKSFLRSGLVSLDPTNGHVKAYVGGLNYAHFQYDMAMQGRRQVGSTMKPFVYAMALEEGYTPYSTIANVQRTYPVPGSASWTPRNGSHARYGQMVTLKWGLSQSNNWVTAGLMYQIDPRGTKLKDFLSAMGIVNSEIHPSLSLCLGTCDITVAEMASAYTAFANKGIRCAPLLVSRIEDSEGNVVATFQPRMNEVISEQTSYQMIDMMRAVIDQGTGQRLRSKYNFTGPIAGKTGTTNNNSDGWFVGYTPDLVTACWVGGEDRDIHFNNTAQGQGAAVALPIWALYMQKVFAASYLGYDPEKEFDLGRGSTSSSYGPARHIEIDSTRVATEATAPEGTVEEVYD